MNNRLPYPCLTVTVVAALPAISAAQVQQRPIEDFVAAQQVVPADVIGWSDPVTNNFLLFDAFGKANERFALPYVPAIDGKVTVRTLADGTAHVSVLAHTTDALCWGSVQPGANDNAFGARPVNVAAGATPAFGSGTTRIEFTMPSASTPLPSLAQLGPPTYNVESYSGTLQCTGALHPASGYPEGTPGRARTTQVGIFATGAPGGCPPEKDANCFPSELVDFHPIGK